MEIQQWGMWALILVAQNVAFTFVSRARGSGSVKHHMIASVFSNGIWFTSQLIIFNVMFDLMKGSHGWKAQVFTTLYYTLWTMLGAAFAHWFCLKFESGKSAVGASKKYAQIPVEDWEAVKLFVGNKLSPKVNTETARCVA